MTMKYVLNILIVAMLLHCSIAWSMFPMSETQKKMRELQVQRLKHKQQLNAAKEILGMHSQTIKNTLKDVPGGGKLSEIPFRASDQTIINLAKVYSDITQEYHQLKQL